MLSLTYVSTATAPVDSEELAAILLESRRNNERCGLTGVLLFKAGRFMQVLEGAEEEVRARFRTIAADVRHSDVKVLLDESTEERRFPRSPMDFPDPPSGETGRARREADPSRAELLLEWFRRRA